MARARQRLEEAAEGRTAQGDVDAALERARAQVEALLCLPNRLIMLVGQAWLGACAQLVRDHEHDEHAWWPADPREWPDVADPALRRLAELLC